MLKQIFISTLKNLNTNALRNNLLFVSRRNSGAYEGYGQTTVNVLNTKNVKVNMISAYSQNGFRLTDNSFALGPIIIFRNKLFCWNIASDEDINEKSLEFFFHLHPPIDLLVIGYSDISNRRNIDQTIPVMCRKHNIQVDILPTIKAVSVYNFLVETRNVAGAFIPPLKYHVDTGDIMTHKEQLGILDDIPETESDYNSTMRLPK
ncbi:hypothetical protein PGB90_009844 [Kerria lacca]